MDTEIETLMVDVRATTDGFQSDIEAMRGSVDSTLIDGFSRAGNTLERGLLSAIRRGSLGFDDLKRIALRSLDEIAAHALQSGIANIFGSAGSTNGGLGNIFTGLLGSVLGLPGRATGGPVSPGSAYVVGERGPEVFVPTSAGRVETGLQNGQSGNNVRVAISLASPRGTDAPVALQRSSRQIASSVRRALETV